MSLDRPKFKNGAIHFANSTYTSPEAFKMNYVRFSLQEDERMKKTIPDMRTRMFITDMISGAYGGTNFFEPLVETIQRAESFASMFAEMLTDEANAKIEAKEE